MKEFILKIYYVNGGVWSYSEYLLHDVGKAVFTSDDDNSYLNSPSFDLVYLHGIQYPRDLYD